VQPEFHPIVSSRFTYHLAAAICQVMDELKMVDESLVTSSRTELDSHANMAVVGRNTTILS